MNNFYTRVLTAVFFGIVFISGIVYNEYSIIALFGLVTVLSLLEYYKLIFKRRSDQNDYWAAATGLMLFVSTTMVMSGLMEKSFLAINILFFTIIFISQLYSKYDRPFKAIAYKLSGLIYIAIPFSLFCSLGFLDSTQYNYELTLGFMFLLWASDTGAYLFGMTMGKHKLFERISPKKSWEGFFGGVIVSLGVAFVLSLYFHSLDFSNWAIIAMLVVVFGTFGDLVESMFKRSLNVKDSGTLLPGHGGILDRFDGLLLAAPVVYAYLVLFL